MAEPIDEKLCNSNRQTIFTRIDGMDARQALFERTLDHRLNQMNEIREQLSTWGRTFSTIQYVDGQTGKIEILIKTLFEKIEANSKSIVELSKKSSMDYGERKWSDYIITVLIGLAVIFIVWLIKGH